MAATYPAERPSPPPAPVDADIDDTDGHADEDPIDDGAGLAADDGDGDADADADAGLREVAFAFDGAPHPATSSNTDRRKSTNSLFAGSTHGCDATKLPSPLPSPPPPYASEAETDKLPPSAHDAYPPTSLDAMHTYDDDAEHDDGYPDSEQRRSDQPRPAAASPLPPPPPTPWPSPRSGDDTFTSIHTLPATSDEYLDSTTLTFMRSRG